MSYADFVYKRIFHENNEKIIFIIYFIYIFNIVYMDND